MRVRKRPTIVATNSKPGVISLKRFVGPVITAAGTLPFGVTLLACAASSKAPENSATSPGGASSTVILRPISFADATLAAGGLGRLDVVMRSAERPTQSLEGASVLLVRVPHDTLRRMTTDARGLVPFDSLPVGSYRVTVRRIGYWRADAQASVSAGCRTDLEVYVGLQATGFGDLPRMQTRTVATTCGISP